MHTLAFQHFISHTHRIQYTHIACLAHSPHPSPLSPGPSPAPQVVVVTDPDLYQPLLRKGPSQLPKYTAPYRMFEVFTNPERSNILSSAENATWKAVRQAAVAALNMNNMRWVLMLTQRTQWG